MLFGFIRDTERFYHLIGGINVFHQFLLKSNFEFGLIQLSVSGFNGAQKTHQTFLVYKFFEEHPASRLTSS